MRIGMILDKPFPPDPRVENEAISLLNAGHSVYLFCLNYNNSLESESVNGIKVRRYRANKLLYKLAALAYTFPFYGIFMSVKIKNFIQKYRIEALHIHDMRVAGSVFKANRKFRLPTVLDLHDNLPEIMKYYPHLQKFPGNILISPKKWKRKEAEFIEKSNYVITVSQEFVDEVIERTKISPNKISLVANTVTTSFYKNAKVNKEIISRYKDRFVILYLGDTALRRGLQTAIDSLVLLKEKIPNVLLVVVGSNTTDFVLKKQVSELKLGPYVDFQGWQDVAFFPSYIEASSICISPLDRNIQHDVAYANKLFQYMSMQRPVLVSNATAQKKLIETTGAGLVHAEKDAADFAEKIIQMHQDDKMCKTMGASGKQFVENEFNWEITSQKLIALYSNLSQ
jgi:glycosyltransferase involved in cell wall biosynthesis